MDAAAQSTGPGAAADEALRIGVLGAVVQVSRGPGPPQPVRGHLAHLLAVLVEAAPRGLRRAELADQLWGGAEGAGGLDPLLSRLRRIAGPIEGRGEVRLVAPPASDLGDARAQLALARAALPDDPATTFAAAQLAAAALAEPWLPGVDHPWVGERRRRLGLARDEARALVAHGALAVGGEALDRGCAAATALVADDPLDELGYELLMRCQLAAGREGSAMGTYARLERVLAAAHGGQPGRALRRLRDEAGGDGTASGAPRPDEAGVGAVQGAAAVAATVPAALVRERRVPFLGRAAELETLATACATAPGPALLLVEGASGLGKTRLLAELAAEIVWRGGRVLHGCSQRADPLPFGAMQQALSGLGLPPLGEGLGDDGRPVDLGAARFRAFGEVGRALAALALAPRADGGADDGPGPLVLLLDDAQWLDPSTAELLLHLLREVRAPGLRIVLSRRPPDDGGDAGAAAAVLASADPVATVHLGGPSPLLERAERDLGAALADHDALGPATAAALDRAGPQPRALVELVAVGGDALTTTEAAAALGWTTESVRRTGAAATAAGLLEDPVGVDGLGALHDARRQAVLAGMTPAAARAAHRALAGALEGMLDASRHGPDTDSRADAWLESYGARLAEHWRAAGGAIARRRAAGYGARAARLALDHLAFERAALLAARAREDLAGSASRATEHAGSRRSLLLLEGRALNAAGRLAQAAPVWLEAIAAAREAGTAEEQADAVLGLAGPRLGGALRLPGLREALEGALDREPADAARRARLRSRLAGELVEGPVDRRRALANEAIAIARTAGDGGDAHAEALLWRHLVMISDAEREGRAALVDEAERIARAAGRLDLALHARMLRFSDLVEAGEIDEAEAELGRWQAEADEARLPYNRWAAAVSAPTIALARCDLAGATTAIGRAERLAAPLGDDPMVRSAIGGQWLTVWLTRGELAPLRAILEPLAADPTSLPVWGVGLAFAELLGGEDARAAALVRGPLAAVAADAVQDSLRLPTLSFLALVASTIAGRLPAEALADLRSACEPHAATWATQHYGSGTHGPLALRIALLDLALGEPERARARIAPYLPETSGGGGHGELVDLAVLQVQARLLAATGRPDEAAALQAQLAAASAAGGAHGWAALFGRAP